MGLWRVTVAWLADIWSKRWYSPSLNLILYTFIIIVSWCTLVLCFWLWLIYFFVLGYASIWFSSQFTHNLKRGCMYCTETPWEKRCSSEPDSCELRLIHSFQPFLIVGLLHQSISLLSDALSSLAFSQALLIPIPHLFHKTLIVFVQSCGLNFVCSVYALQTRHSQVINFVALK